MGGKKSTFISLNDVSGKLSSFGSEIPDPSIEVFASPLSHNQLSHSLSELRVVRVQKSVNCYSNRGIEFWNLTTNTLSLQFSNEMVSAIPHLHD